MQISSPTSKVSITLSLLIWINRFSVFLFHWERESPLEQRAFFREKKPFTTCSIVGHILTFCDPFSLKGMRPRHLGPVLSQFQPEVRPRHLLPLACWDNCQSKTLQARRNSWSQLCVMASCGENLSPPLNRLLSHTEV